MCGIFGVIGSDLQEDKLNEAVNILSHRGPDDKGSVFLDNLVFLGHTRLRVIDLSNRGKQPMSTSDSSAFITYNGEVYNFQRLRGDLEKKGYKFNSNTDTEVILNLYKEKGINCLGDLNGMFAFAIYDRINRKVFLARDRVGIKPLYYSIYNSKLIFASEIKAILSSGLVPKEVDWQAIYDYFTYFFELSPSTAYEYIKQLPPAHYLIYDIEKNNIEVKCYWEPFSKNGKTSTYKDLCEELNYLLEDSLKLQLISDVPLGVFLSGGIDSSIITALASKNSSRKLKTFTVIFEDAKMSQYDEQEYAREVSNYLQSEHTELPIKLTNPEEIFNLITCFDQPYGNPTLYLSYLISKVTKEHVTVVLSGAGGDELFGGYPRYRVLQYAKYLSSLPKSIGKILNSATKSLAFNDLGFLSRRLTKLFDGFGKPLSKQYLKWAYYFDENEKSQLLKPLLVKNGSMKSSERIVNSYFASYPAKDLLNHIQYADLKLFLADNILEYTDKTSMAFGLETRVPFLDHRIIELSFKIPYKYKIGNFNSKIILKDIFKDRLPEKIIRAPKRGFCAPISIWMEKNFDYYFDKILTPEYIGKQGVFNWEYIQQLRREYRNKKKDNSMELFSIIMFDVWMKKYIY